MSDRPTGPLGVDPLHYVCVVFGLLICWVGYLLLPKGMRQQHFGAYPKRFRWSARPRSKRGGVDGSGSGGIAGRGQVSTMLHRVKGGGKASACLHLSANHRSERRSVCVIFIFSYSSSRIDVVQEAYLSYFNNPPPHQKHACMVIPHPVYQPTQIIIGTWRRIAKQLQKSIFAGHWRRRRGCLRRTAIPATDGWQWRRIRRPATANGQWRGPAE